MYNLIRYLSVKGSFSSTVGRARIMFVFYKPLLKKMDGEK